VARLLRILLTRVGAPPERTEEIIDTLAEAHQRVGLWTVAIDGAVATVRELKEAGLRLGVVSNAEGRVAIDLDGAGYAGSSRRWWTPTSWASRSPTRRSSASRSRG
jgi:FMN phosphatase YigB (HAD superfamily)